MSVARLAAGDWVVIEGKDPTKRGVGKIVDGQYADDDTLESARVEFSNGASWFGVGDLGRVTPDEEAAVCDAALDGEHVSGDRAARLREEVAAFRAEKIPFVRSPGLLDRLWVCLPDPLPEGPRTGLARFFDEESRAVVLRWRVGAGRTRGRAGQRWPVEDSAIVDAVLETSLPFALLPDEMRAALRPVLASLPRGTLLRIADAEKIAAEGDEAKLREALRVNVTLGQVVRVLDRDEVTRAATAIGLSTEDQDTLRRRLLKALVALADPSDRPDLERMRVMLRALGTKLLQHNVKRVGVPVPDDGSEEPEVELLVRCVHPGLVVARLKPKVLVRLCEALGVSARGESPVLRARIVEACTS